MCVLCVYSVHMYILQLVGAKAFPSHIVTHIDTHIIQTDHTTTGTHYSLVSSELLLKATKENSPEAQRQDGAE